MKIGIFIHSQSGHTSTVGMALVNKLREKGHDVDIALLRSVKRARPFMKHVELKKAPEISNYDVVVLGGPVWFFHPSPLLLSFIDEIPHLKNKKACCFVTTMLPARFSRGKAVLVKLGVKLDALGATVLESESYCWGLWLDRKRLDRAAQKMSRIILS
jgi:menaquinone-dependent protoporphyrinogen IX oxidase